MTDAPLPAAQEPAPPAAPAAAAEPSRMRCPACGARAVWVEERGEDWARCGSCTSRYRVVSFAPLLEAAEMAVGAGRCANHPGKDAVAPCERCGAFVCDVCTTRTGEHMLCPDCFGLLHERGQLETTRTSRTRWEYVTLGMCLGNALFCFLTAPVSLALSVWLLFRMRRDLFLRPGYVVAALVISVLELAAVVSLFAGTFT